jgi:DNA-binding response OmpR family regulator
MSILLIEDEDEVAAFIKKTLAENDYSVVVKNEGNEGLAAALNDNFDLILLDLRLPGISGIEICKKIREEKINTPILMLTAMGTIGDRVKGLECGADDYLTKPFHIDELLARIKALIRRQASASQDKTYRVADLELNCYRRTVTRNGKPIVLTSKEFILLELLMANKNKILSRSYIATTVWGKNFDKGSNVIDVYVNFLRSKIDKDSEVKLIQTVIGMGYMIKE